VRVMTLVKGYMGSVTFDGTLVIIEKKMRGQTRIPLAGIQAISIDKAGIGWRAVRFSVAGGSTAHVQTAFGDRKDSAMDPNALTFRKGDLPKFEALVTEIEQARQS
jgi:hypothetical protein